MSEIDCLYNTPPILEKSAQKDYNHSNRKKLQIGYTKNGTDFRFAEIARTHILKNQKGMVINMFDVAIIGAGVVGGMLARELSRYELNVCIIEKESDVAMGATKANSAIVHAGFDALPESLKAELNVKGSLMMEKVAEELGVRYKKNGSIVVGFNEDDRKTLNGLLERGIKNGVKGLYIAEREELLKLEPNIGDEVICALVAPSGAIICPYGLCIAAIGNAMDNGVSLKLSHKVTAVEDNGESYTVKCETGESIESRYVVNCSGVYSDEVAKMAGDDSFSVTPRRGEYVLMDRDLGSLITHTVFCCPSKMGKGILVTPTVDGNLLLGPTAEDIEDKSCTDTTKSGTASVYAQAARQVKNINFGMAITGFAGIRATGSTGDFIINMPRERFVNAAGIESPGLSASPAIAEYIVDMLFKNGLCAEKKRNFIATRRSSHWFSELSDEGKDEVIKLHPEYAHIVCRCETISEGEILDAIHTNPKPTDVDGIKRRTRASMGRCQGGFCSPIIVEILARELKCDYGEITKLGGSSYINIGRTK